MPIFTLPISLRHLIALSCTQTSIATTVLGGMSTLAASYLAKSRGTGEPEASQAMAKDLQSFVRDCESVMLDKGHHVGEQYDDVVQSMRDRLEAILGNRPKSLGERLKERIYPSHEQGQGGGGGQTYGQVYAQGYEQGHGQGQGGGQGGYGSEKMPVGRMA